MNGTPLFARTDITGSPVVRLVTLALALLVTILLLNLRGLLLIISPLRSTG
jgi:hypothetical protein